MSKKYTLTLLAFCYMIFLPGSLALAQDGFDFGQDASGIPASSGLFDSFISGSAVGTLFGHDFTGFGIIDMAVAAIALYVMFKLILLYGLSSHDNDTPRPLDPNHIPDEDDPKRAIKMQALNAWARLRSESENEEPNTSNLQDARLPRQEVKNGIEEFDREDFLDGAKLLYTRLQKAWAARELGQLEEFITPDMLEVLSAHAKQHPEKTAIEVVLVSPTLIDVNRSDLGALQAKVLFSALISQEGADHPIETKEIWYFVFDPAQQTTWQLDGIEPVTNNNQ